MYKSIIARIRKDILFLVLAFCLVSSSLAIIPQGTLWYMAGILIGGYIVLKKCSYFFINGFLIFIFCCFLSSLIAGRWDYRLFTFSIVLFFITPIISSYKVFVFRFKYLKYCFFIFPFLSLLSLFCYFMGINVMAIKPGDVNWDFSAVFWHSMWLGAACGVSNVVLTWIVIEAKRKKIKMIFVAWLFASVFVSVIAASRSALLASLIAMSVIVFLKLKNVKQLVTYGVIIVLAVMCVFPLYEAHSVRMQAKMEHQEKAGTNSRTHVWSLRALDFKESPIVGMGFASSHVSPTKIVVGRLESGSGWFSVSCQTGILGSLVFLSLLLVCYRRIKPFLRRDVDLLLFVGVFVFLCMHSAFEAYILTAGYYLCILFWGILGIFYEYPKYMETYLLSRKEDEAVSY